MGIEFEDNRLKVKEALYDAGEAFIHEACGELQSRTQRNSRVDTGQTKGSYSYKVSGSFMTVRTDRKQSGKCHLGGIWNWRICIAWRRQKRRMGVSITKGRVLLYERKKAETTDAQCIHGIEE
mgnify:CR=1 FL=1